MSRARLVSLCSFVLAAALTPACTSHHEARQEARAVPSPDLPAAPGPSASAPARARPAPVRGLWAELLPGGPVQASPADPKGKPAPTSLFLRVHNTTRAPIALRTGGDDESVELAVRGPAVARAPHDGPCNEIYLVGRTSVVPAGGSLDVPLRVLVAGERCGQTSFYLEKTGTYEVDATLRAHVMTSETDTGRGQAVDLAAATLSLSVG